MELNNETSFNEEEWLKIFYGEKKIKKVPRNATKSSDIYVSRRTPQIVYFKRSQELLALPFIKSINIHGSGSCIKGAIWLVQDILANATQQLDLKLATSSTPIKLGECEQSEAQKYVSNISIEIIKRE